MDKSTKEIFKVTCKILSVIFIVELSIMYVLSLYSGYIPSNYVPWLDVFLLALIVTPIIVIWVIKPYVLLQQQTIANAEFSAFHDPLTKLPNRRFLTEDVDKSLGVSSRNNHVGALIFLDLDGFKKINDTNGHAIGDEVLIEVARRLTNSVRTEDIVSRHGGDEFIIFLQDSGATLSNAREHLHSIIDKVRTHICPPIVVNTQSFDIDCSFGVSILSGNWVSSALAIHEADMAMYQAKQTPDCKVVFSSDLFIEWYSYARTGIDEIDREHQQIDFLVKNFLVSTEDKIDSLKIITESLKKHFYSEEWICNQKALNMTDEHIREHRRLEKLLLELSSTLDVTNSLEALNTVEQVIKLHVASFDSKLLNVGEEA